MSQNSNPLVAVTIGDPSGVGTEITVKALAAGAAQNARIMIVGNQDGIEQTAHACNVNLKFQRVSSPAEARALTNGAVAIYDDAAITSSDYTVGKPSAAGGNASAGWISKTVAWAEAAAIDAFIIGPVDNASYKLAGFTSSPPGMHPKDAYLMRTSGKLRFIPIGEHVMMRDVPPMVTKQNVLHVITLIAKSLTTWGVKNPRIAVAGLNPHAAGTEDANEISPAVAEAQAAGLTVKGPLSPDTVFRRALHGEFDVVVAMYHDQGQIAIKTTGLEEACAIFIGTPYIRVGTPHGSAMDIAGKNQAQHGTMQTALNAAANLAAGQGL